jgi:TetR/AcrR family fatty acid metabolism transcriptional regulator
MSKKELIKDAAVRIIARDGFFNATTDKISKEAQVPVGSIYTYFRSKEEILDYIFEVEFQKRYDFYQNIKTWHMDWFLKINGILNFHLQEIKKDPNIAMIILTERINAYRYKLQSAMKFTELSSIISDILRQAIDDKKIRPCNVTAITLYIDGFLDELTYEILTTNSSDIIEPAIDEFCKLLKISLNINPPHL